VICFPVVLCEGFDSLILHSGVGKQSYADTGMHISRFRFSGISYDLIVQRGGPPPCLPQGGPFSIQQDQHSCHYGLMGITSILAKDPFLIPNSERGRICSDW
jgi:hypothetical protein